MIVELISNVKWHAFDLKIASAAFATATQALQH
jgi:hypothetical protein